MSRTDNAEETDYSSSLAEFSHDVDEAVWGWSSDSETSDPAGRDEEGK